MQRRGGLAAPSRARRAQPGRPELALVRGAASGPELGELLAVASHELKTPATVIKTQAQLLLRCLGSGAPAGEDMAEGLTMIAQQADRLGRLINTLLDLSRIEAGQLELERVPTDLGRLAESVAAALQVTTDRHCLDVVAEPGVVGSWDPRRLEEVITNLLGNAIKYSPRGGRIEVRVEARDHAACVTLRDPGLGVAPEDLPHLFERFYRGRARQGIDGDGLGLSICRALVVAHGGQVWAESDGPGRGSTFGFSLPLTGYPSRSSAVGSSTSSLTRTRNWTASRPSTRRWS